MGTRAGLFRIWAVASVVWIAGVGFVGLQSVSEHAGAASYIYLPGDPRRFVPYDPPADADNVRFLAMFDGTRLYFPRSTWQRDDIPRIADVFWQRRWLHYWNLLRNWLVLFVVPGVVFLVVYAMLWVLDGFRPGR